MLDMLQNSDQESLFLGMLLVVVLLFIFELIALLESIVMYYMTYKKIYEIHKSLAQYVRLYNLSKKENVSCFDVEIRGWSHIVVYDCLEYFGYKLNVDGTYSKRDSLFKKILRMLKNKKS